MPIATSVASHAREGYHWCGLLKCALVSNTGSVNGAAGGSAHGAALLPTDTSTEWDSGANGRDYSDDEEHEDGLALVYAGPPPDQQHWPPSKPQTETAPNHSAALPAGLPVTRPGLLPLQPQQQQPQPQQTRLLQPSPGRGSSPARDAGAADVPVVSHAALAYETRAPGSNAALSPNHDAAGGGEVQRGDHAEEVDGRLTTAEEADVPLMAGLPFKSVAAVPEQEAADRAYAQRLHREQVAEEAARRKRARVLSAASGLAKRGKSGEAVRKQGPLDTFVVRTPST
jgi:hypothetical protein